MSYKRAINKVVKYINALGVEVNLNSRAWYFDREEEVICGAKNSNELITLCSLLHEAGHIVQTQSTFECFKSTTLRNKAIILEQEYTAWKEGWSIAESLNITDSSFKRVYRKLWMSCWMSYVTRLTQPDSKEYTRCSVYGYVN